MPRIDTHRMPEFCADLTRLRPALQRYAQRLCQNPDESEDLVQETLVRAITKAHNYTHGTNLRAWLFTILRHIHFAGWARRKRLAPWDPQIEESLAISGGQEDAARLTQISDRIASLPRPQRDALLLVGVGGCSYQEAAKIGGCAVGTMKSRVSRARSTIVQGNPTTEHPTSGAGLETLIVQCSALLNRQTAGTYS